VGIDHERVRPVAPIENVTHFRQNACCSRVRGVDVQPELFARTDVSDRGNGIDGGRRRRADGSHDRQGDHSGFFIRRDRGFESVRVHAEGGIS
jgi:hypothetical protein